MVTVWKKRDCGVRLEFCIRGMLVLWGRGGEMWIEGSLWGPEDWSNLGQLVHSPAIHPGTYGAL